jgi:hypothetical protein
LRSHRPCRTRNAGAARSCRRRQLRHKELAAVDVEVPARNGEQVGPVLHCLREPDNDLRIVCTEHLHLGRLAENDRRFLPEVQAAQRNSLALHINVRREHDGLPAVVSIVIARVIIRVAEMSFRCGRRLGAARGTHDHRRYSGELVSLPVHNERPPRLTWEQSMDQRAQQ